jgi:hypothetical protein|nr:MAG TPA: hypothetical protein [Bacteriophage sp.]
MRVEKIEGLESLPPDDLSPDEHEQLAQAKESAEEEQKEQTDIDLLLNALSDKEDAPKVYDIEAWLEKYGTIHVSSVLGGKDIFIWRVLRRQEYSNMIKQGMMDNEIRAEDSVVRRCLLYPEAKQEFLTTAPAGFISTLKEQIMYRSGFVPLQQAYSQIKIL